MALEQNTIVICAGGGGIPTMYQAEKKRWLTGIEAVIDKDLASELLARGAGCGPARHRHRCGRRLPGLGQAGTA